MDGSGEQPDPPARTADLRSAPFASPGAGDRIRGPADAPLVVVYADFECPFCAAVDARLRERYVRVAFRHFPVRSKHPRAWPAAAAAEAAALQGKFWEMHDSLLDDTGRLEDPHLWERARRLGLDVGRFQADRRSDAVRERIESDFRAGIRVGVAATPTLFMADGRCVARELDEALAWITATTEASDTPRTRSR